MLSSGLSEETRGRPKNLPRRRSGAAAAYHCRNDSASSGQFYGLMLWFCSVWRRSFQRVLVTGTN